MVERTSTTGDVGSSRSRGVGYKATAALLLIVQIAMPIMVSATSTSAAAQAATPLVPPPAPPNNLTPWPIPAAGPAAGCTGNDCIKKFTDGSSIGYDILQWGVTNQKDPQRRNNLNTGAVTSFHSSSEPTRQNPTGTMSTRSFVPGGASTGDMQSLVDLGKATMSGNTGALRDAALAQRRNSNEAGCRKTTFENMEVVWFANIQALATQRIADGVAAPPPELPRYKTVTTGTATLSAPYAISMPVMGSNTSTRTREITPPSGVGIVNGISVETSYRPFQVASDGTFVVSKVGAWPDDALLTVSSAGRPKDSFKVTGSLSSIPASGVWLYAYVLRVKQTFSDPALAPGGVCPADPPNCSSPIVGQSGLTANYCSGTPYTGIADVFDRGTTNNPRNTQIEGHETLARSIEAPRAALVGGDPIAIVDTMMPGSRNTIAGNPPVVPRTANYTPFSFTMGELFQGCIESTTTTNGTAPTTRRELDLQTCVAQLNPNIPRTCSGTRQLGFADLGNYTLATFTAAKKTKTGSCPPGTTVVSDLPPVRTSPTEQLEQQRLFKWNACPVSAPHYIGNATPGEAVQYDYRVPDVSGNAWGPWTPFNNIATVCSATPPAQPITAPPDQTDPNNISGTASVSACMPGRFSINGLNTVNTPSTYTGRLNFAVQLIGASSFEETPIDPAPGAPGVFEYMQIQYDRLGLDPRQHFPASLSATVTGGSSAVPVITTFGSADDGWTIKGYVDVVGISTIRLAANVKLIAANQITGCERYMDLLADRTCTIPSGQMSCTDNRAPSTVVNGVTLATTGPLAGVTALLKPWGSPVSAQVLSDGSPSDIAGGPPLTYLNNPLCFKANGPALSCQLDTPPTNWANHFPTEPQLNEYVDNCALVPRNSSPPTTTPLTQDATCKFISPGACVSGAVGAISGTCYQREVLYDCGRDVLDPNALTTTRGIQFEQQCTSALRCIGTECHAPITEVSQDFGEAASAGEIANAINNHMTCAETGEAPNASTSTCTPTLFGGAMKRCLTPLTSQVGVGNNCCKLADDQAAGLDMVKWVAVLRLAWKLKDTKIAQTALSSFGTTTGISSAYANITQSVTSTVQPLTNAWGNLMQQLGFNPTTTTAVAGSATATSTTASGLFNPIAALEEKIKSTLIDLLSPLFQQTGQTAALATEQAKQFLDKLNNVLFWYSVAQLIGSLIYSCNENQLSVGLGMDRKGGSCHYIGTRRSGLVDRYAVYCCFASPLARIMQENFRNARQGSLNANGNNLVSGSRSVFYGQELWGGWGTPDAPKCDGIFPAQLGDIDFGKVDLSEWIDLLRRSGSLPANDADQRKRYAIDANMTNVHFPNVGVNNTDTPQPGPDAPFDRKKAIIAYTDKYADTFERVNDYLSPQDTCYEGNDGLGAWYATPAPVTAEDVISDMGGTGTYTSCGTGCVEVTLGKQQDNVFSDSCTRIYPQMQGFMVRRPDYIQSATITQAAWDDHLQIVVNSSPVFTSSGWFSAPPNGTGTCDLRKSWVLNSSTPCVGGSCTIHSPSYNTIDVTAPFKAGGVVSVDTRVIVGGGGEGYAKMQIRFGAPVADPANPQRCVRRDGRVATPPPP